MNSMNSMNSTNSMNSMNSIRTFLEEVRGDQFSDSFSILIQSNDNEYYSNRILKSASQLKYIYTIHEVITPDNNINVTVPFDRSYVLDYRSEYMENRTNKRKELIKNTKITHLSISSYTSSIPAFTMPISRPARIA